MCYGGSQDYAFLLIVVQKIEDIQKNGLWITPEQGIEFVGANDVFGVAGKSKADSQRSGGCLFVTTGTSKLQGRVASKVYGLLHLVGQVGMDKNTVESIAISMREIDPTKFEFFAETLKIYFAKYIWAEKDERNRYAKKVTNSVYRLTDSLIGVSKFYCYNPTIYNKEEMMRGVRGVPSEERPELSPHYECAKDAFKNG